ncbi:MAG: hypothetical protein MZV64_62830 [Ignavibacteriales bacterium]|nr:hypothetical protein [Ignavibacteriales bacterium]
MLLVVTTSVVATSLIPQRSCVSSRQHCQSSFTVTPKARATIFQHIHVRADTAPGAVTAASANCRRPSAFSVCPVSSAQMLTGRTRSAPFGQC